MVRAEGTRSPLPERSRLPKRGRIFDQSSTRHRRISLRQGNSEEVGPRGGKILFVPDYIKLQKRDESEWETWISKVTPSFIESALKVLPDIHIVEDLVQDAWLQVYQRIDILRPENLNWYVETTIHNKIKDHFRRARVRLTVSNDIPEQKSSDDVEEEIVRQDQARRLKRYIDQLTPEQREAVLDFAFGLTPTEVEQMIGTATGVIKARRHRGFRTLKRLIETQE